MALDDIVLGSDDVREAISEIPLGALNSPDDILTESGSSSGAALAELVINVENSNIFIF